MRSEIIFACGWTVLFVFVIFMLSYMLWEAHKGTICPRLLHVLQQENNSGSKGLYHNDYIVYLREGCSR